MSGRTKLYLLDTDLELNDERGRHVSDRLYGGDREHRMRQELLMGIGGVRALRLLGYDPKVFHLNEGHAGFLALELLGDELDKGMSLGEAVEAVKPRIVFTTHTPVPAGIDRFSYDLMQQYVGVWVERYGVSMDDLLALANLPGEDGVFNMAAFCLGVARRSNGVSSLHGEVSRKMFAEVPGGPEITSVTNGVHARTWVDNDLQAAFEESLGPDWGRGADASWGRGGRPHGRADSRGPGGRPAPTHRAGRSPRRAPPPSRPGGPHHRVRQAFRHLQASRSVAA